MFESCRAHHSSFFGSAFKQITYTYDSLNRLASATGSGWGQSYGYDGFGNLTNQTVTSGTAPSLNTTYNPATNRQTGECADANGNLNSAPTCWNQAMYYDVENRPVKNSGYLAWAYSYAPGNKRVWRGVWVTNNTQTVDEVTFWGVNGQKLTTYSLSMYNNQFVATSTGSNYYFGGKLIKNATGYVGADRIGSIGKYFPYGQERPSATTDGKEKFATYFRDSETGLDYADQRYHQPGMGRFMTPDSAGGAHPNDPSTLNKYSYTGGDPINRVDPSGNDWLEGVYDWTGGMPCVVFNLSAGPGLNQGDCPMSTSWWGGYFGSVIGTAIANAVSNGCATVVALGYTPAPSSACGDVPTQTVQNPPPPTCDQALTLSIQTFLATNDAPLLAWDPNLAADLVAAGASVDIDPRLMASIATVESGHGKTLQNNNPFGLKDAVYSSSSSAIRSEGRTLNRMINGPLHWGIPQMYSGNPGAYCQGDNAKQKADCQAAGQSISTILNSFGGNLSVGLKPGNSNSLGYPCPQ